MMLRATVFLLLALGAPPLALAWGWTDSTGKVLPESDDAKTREGFSAALVMTPDKDWKAKWETPPETVPNLSTSSEVEPGGELNVLTILSNPAIGEDGMTDVSCDLRVTRPDGSVSAREVEIPCFDHRLTTDPTHVYMTPLAIQFTAEPGDLRGRWVVAVNVRDNVRDVEIPLTSSFLVK